MIEKWQAAFDARHDAQQPAFALQQRQTGRVLAVDVQHVEGAKVRPLAPEQQLVEVRAAIGFEAADLTVEHR